MSALALAAWKDWRDRVAARSLMPALVAWAVAASFRALGPFLLAASLAASFALAGWFAGRRYGPGSFGRERLSAASLRSGQYVLALSLASGAMCLCWLLAAAAPLTFVALSSGLSLDRLPLVGLALSGIWYCSFGGAFLSSMLRKEEDGAAGLVFALAWLSPTLALPFLRWLNPILHAWSAYRGFSAWPALAASAAEALLGAGLLALGAQRIRPAAAEPPGPGDRDEG